MTEQESPKPAVGSPVSGVSDAYLLSMRDALVRSLPALEELTESQEDLRDYFTVMRMGAKLQLVSPQTAEERANTEMLLGYIKRLLAYFDGSTKVLTNLHRLGVIVRTVQKEHAEG